jgi:2-methylcitrate dehydratase PrpD
MVLKAVDHSPIFTGDVSRWFADLVVAQTRCTQPPDVVHAARRCIVDWFAATIPGAFEKPAQALERGLLGELGHGSSWTVSGRKAPMRIAALINGVASHTVEFDDIFAPAIYHPGSPVIAAALASAIGLGKTGRDLVNAVIAGYEVSTRMGAALGRTHYKYWHNTGTVGTVGATAAVALLHDLDHARIAHALSTSVTMAAGLQAAFRGDSEIKPLHAGHAADSGHVAVALAQGDVVAASGMFEGPVGIANAMSKNVFWDLHLNDPEDFNITRMTVKNHGCCGHIFAALDGVLALQKEHSFSVDDISEIAIGGYQATVDVTGNYDADTPGAAKFCLPFIVASGIVHGSIRLDAYTPARLADPAVRKLMPRIRVALDRQVDKLFPAQRAANVTVSLQNGTVLQLFQPHRIGDPDLPLSDEQLSGKFLELATSVIPESRARPLLERLWEIEHQLNLHAATRIN